jgi:hypothetical protein
MFLGGLTFWVFVLAKMFVVLPEDVDENLAGDWIKCGGCGWRVSRLYVLANSKEEAVKLVKSGDAGLCGDCVCDMLAEGDYEITSPRKT